MAPEDPINLFTNALGLLARDGESHAAEADGLLRRALQLAPVGELAEKIKAQQRQHAARVMRANVKGEPRRDAVTYLRSALEAYQALDLNGQKQLLAEVAAIAQKGLAINDPQQTLHLRLYRGGRTVSALQAACILYAGVQLLLPREDAGIDLGREYEMARGMVGGAMRTRSDSMPQSRRAVELPKTVPASAGMGMRARVTRGGNSLLIKSRRGLNSPSLYDPI